MQKILLNTKEDWDKWKENSLSEKKQLVFDRFEENQPLEYPVILSFHDVYSQSYNTRHIEFIYMEDFNKMKE